MNKTWQYLNNEDYHSWIKQIKNLELKWKLISMYRSGRPMLRSSYNQLKKKYISIYNT